MKKTLAFSSIVIGLTMGSAQAAEPGIKPGFARNMLLGDAKVGLRAPTKVFVLHFHMKDERPTKTRKT